MTIFEELLLLCWPTECKLGLGQIVNIFLFVVHAVSLGTTQAEAAIDKSVNEWHGRVPVKLYLPKQAEGLIWSTGKNRVGVDIGHFLYAKPGKGSG